MGSSPFGGIESAIAKIVNSGGTPPTTVSTPTMAHAGFPGMTPPAPPAQPQQPAAASGGGGMSAAMPLMGAGLGYMAGGPRGAMQAALPMAMMAGASAAGQPELGLMAPLAMQAMGMGGGDQPPQPPQVGIHPSQSPIQPGITGGGMMARQQPPTTGGPGMPRNLPPQVLQALGLG